MSRDVIGSIEAETGKKLVHQLGGLANYGTLCGLSLDDDLFLPFSPPPRARISCPNCKSVWMNARLLRSDDFYKDQP